MDSENSAENKRGGKEETSVLVTEYTYELTPLIIKKSVESITRTKKFALKSLPHKA